MVSCQITYYIAFGEDCCKLATKTRTTRGICYTLYIDDNVRQNIIGEVHGLTLHLNSNEWDEPGKDGTIFVFGIHLINL